MSARQSTSCAYCGRETFELRGLTGGVGTPICTRSRCLSTFWEDFEATTVARRRWQVFGSRPGAGHILAVAEALGADVFSAAEWEGAARRASEGGA